jgi:hypothetical protein
MNRGSSNEREGVEIAIAEVVVVAKIGGIVRVVASIVLREMASSRRRVVREMAAVVLVIKCLLEV